MDTYRSSTVDKNMQGVTFRDPCMSQWLSNRLLLKWYNLRNKRYWYESKLRNSYLEFCLFSEAYLFTHGYTIHRRSENFRLSKVKTSACGVDISIYFLQLAHWVMSSRCQTVAAKEPAVFTEC